MKEPLTAPWDLPTSDAGLEKLKVGFRARDIDDNYDILIENPDESGNISNHIIRNWLQEECYIIHIVPKPSNDSSRSAKIQGITWEGNKNWLQCNEEHAKKEAVILSKMFLNCEIETLPDCPLSMMWDPSAYKKLDKTQDAE